MTILAENTRILDKAVESCADEMISSLKTLIRIPSVAGEQKPGAPYGTNVAKALDYMLEKAASLGFHSVNFDGQIGYCEYGEGDIIAVVSHLDVVPAGDGWTHDPFGAEEEAGLIYGRGTVDDKGPAMASLYALYALKESGLPIGHKIRLMFGTNEENGSTDMKYFFEHGGEEPAAGFTPDGSFPVINGEKGILISSFKKEFNQSGKKAKLLSVKGGTAFNVVPAKACAVIECDDALASNLLLNKPDHITLTHSENKLIAEAEGVSAHGSTPEKGINAISCLAAFLKDVPFDKDVSDVFRFIDEKIGSDTTGERIGINLHDSVSGSLVLNLGTIDGDDSSITLCINYRYPVTFSLDNCAPLLNEVFAQNGFSLVSQQHEHPLYMDPDSVMIQTLTQVYNEYTGENAKPFCIGGGTYAKSVPNIVAFGPCFPGDDEREHKPDEYIETDKLILCAKIYAAAMYRLSSQTF